MARKRDAPMAQDVETIAEFIREAPDAGAAYRAMLRQVIRAGEQVLGPERADATLDELLLEENAAQAERFLEGLPRPAPPRKTH